MSTRKSPTTLKDIAEAVGVSPTVVSHVLNNRLGHVRVGEAKRLRILATARRMAYVPKLQARSMATQRSYAVGVLASFGPPETEGPATAVYFSSALRGVESVCQAVDYHCVFASCNLYDPAQYVHPRLMQDGAVDGVILVGRVNPEVVARLMGMGLPCVQVGSNAAEESGVVCVDSDFDGGLAETARRLAAWGHRRVELHLPQGPGPDKIAAHFMRLAEAIPDFEPSVVLHEHDRLQEHEAEALGRAWAEPRRRPTAVIAAPLLAEGLAHALAGVGLRFPDDYSLITFGAQDLAGLRVGPDARPAAMIGLPVRETGARAAARLFELLPQKIDRRLPRFEGERAACTFHDAPSWGPPPGAADQPEADSRRGSPLKPL